MLADGINIPFVLGAGAFVLLPLLAFEIFAEAYVLRAVWRQKYADLCRFTLAANILSLLAGIPVKMFNASLYTLLLPQDLAGFFARYPFAVGIGSLNYFLATIAVEGLYAIRWLKKSPSPVTKSRLFGGILLANLATYAVLAPLHYFATRPTTHVKLFTPDTSWSSETNTTVLFVDQNSQLNSVRVNGSDLKRLVPAVVKDYLISTNFNFCLFRAGDGNLHSYRRDTAQSNLVWQTRERFQMEQVAFSPSGEHVAVAEREGNYVEVIEIQTGKRTRQMLLPRFNFNGPTLTWSTNEMKFYLRGFDSSEQLAVNLQPDLTLEIQSIINTNGLPVLACFGRTGEGGWYGSDDWGRCYNSDSCAALKAWSEPGLGSSLRIYRDGADERAVISLHVNPGLLHLARFYFEDVAFVGNCQECLFGANGYIYLLDMQNKRVGMLARGDRFILLTDRYRKRF